MRRKARTSWFSISPWIGKTANDVSTSSIYQTIQASSSTNLENRVAISKSEQFSMSLQVIANYIDFHFLRRKISFSITRTFVRRLPHGNNPSMLCLDNCEWGVSSSESIKRVVLQPAREIITCGGILSFACLICFRSPLRALPFAHEISFILRNVFSWRKHES